MNFLLIGRPNAGKSSIFNYLTKKNFNIVHEQEGTTRDWHKEIIKDTNCVIYDTPGILINNNKQDFLKVFFDKNLKFQIDSFLYVIEYKNGFNEIDNFSINQLRRYNKEIILIINKFDNYKLEPDNEFTKYGIPLIFYISCSHNFGFEKLKCIFKDKKQLSKSPDSKEISIAFFGKPNAGKSTLLNTLVGYNRSQTSPLAGTTSDLVTDNIFYNNYNIQFIDTAGIGRKANIKDKSINYYSVKKSFEGIGKFDFSLVLVDAYDGLDRQDKRIINMISNKSKSILMVFNKFDLIDNKIEYKKNIINDIGSSLSEIKNIKLFFISAFKSKNAITILDYILEHHTNFQYNISTSKLNQWLKNVVKEKTHPLINGKKVNFKYAVQVKVKPVTIKIFCSYSSKLRSNYKKFLTNNFNYHFNILNQKTKIIFSSSENPYI